MNIVQAIDHLIKNPQAMIYGKCGNLDYYAKKDESGAIIHCDHKGNILSVFALTKAKLDMRWEAVRKPVDFMTAVNSGKEIKPMGHGAFMTVNYWLKNYRLSIGQVNGEWEIE